MPCMIPKPSTDKYMTCQNPNSILADLASMVLSNITSTASIANALLTLKVSILPDPKASTGYYPTQSRSGTSAAPVPYPSGEPEDVLSLPLLVDAFVQGAAVDDEQDPDKRPRKASLHFLSSVFANISIVSSHIEYPLRQLFYIKSRVADTSRSDVLLDHAPFKLSQARRGSRISAR